jgi:cytochrome P450
VRVGPNELSFNSAQAWEDIYGHRIGHPNMHKDPIHVGSVEPLVGVTTLTMADDENHARQRRALAHSFSQKALSEQEPILQNYVDKLITNLKRMGENDEEFNLVNWLNFTTFDIIGDLAFGDPFGCLDDGSFLPLQLAKYSKLRVLPGTFHAWVSLIYETVKAGALEQATRRFADAGSTFQNFLLWCLPSDGREKRKSHLRRSREKVMRRLTANKDTDHRDFIWYIQKQQSKFDIAQDEIIVNAALFIVAGSETTANLLSGLIARLLRDPGKFTKLKAEIRALKEADLTYETLKALPYINACLEEGLRIHPVRSTPFAVCRNM